MEYRRNCVRACVEMAILDMLYLVGFKGWLYRGLSFGAHTWQKWCCCRCWCSRGCDVGPVKVGKVGCGGRVLWSLAINTIVE